MCHAAFFLKSSRHTPCTTNSQLPTTNCQSPTAMTLTNEQPFIYAWHYKNDTVCKLGVSTTRKFHTLIKAAKSVTWQDIELLGIELYDTHAAAQAAYKELLKTFDRVHSRRAWVHLNDAVRAWLGNGCLPNPPSLDAFREVFQNDPATSPEGTRVSTPACRKTQSIETAEHQIRQETHRIQKSIQSRIRP